MILDTQLADTRSAWDMQPDGTYVARGGDGQSSQERFIDAAEEEVRSATGLRNRTTRSVASR